MRGWCAAVLIKEKPGRNHAGGAHYIQWHPLSPRHHPVKIIVVLRSTGKELLRCAFSFITYEKAATLFVLGRRAAEFMFMTVRPISISGEKNWESHDGVLLVHGWTISVPAAQTSGKGFRFSSVWVRLHLTLIPRLECRHKCEHAQHRSLMCICRQLLWRAL